MPVGGNRGQIHGALQSRIHHEPDGSLAGDRIFPHQIGVMVAIEVAYSCDMPIGGNRGQVGIGLLRSILEQPDDALAGCCILPNQIRRSVAINIFGNTAALGISEQKTEAVQVRYSDSGAQIESRTSVVSPVCSRRDVAETARLKELINVWAEQAE